MKNLGYYNGEIGELERMRVPMCDRVCFFGDGVYDATYARNHVVFALDEHLDRFYDNVRRVGLNLTQEKRELKTRIERLARKVDCDEQFVYWQATRGTAIRDHLCDPATTANLWVVIKPASVKDVSRPVSVIVERDERHLNCDVKTLNLLPNVLALERARRAGADEVVFHREGRVTECAHSNVHILRAGCLVTAPADRNILNGICRRHLIALCARYGVPVLEIPYTVRELKAADEVLLTSAGSFAVRVGTVDGERVGGKAPELLERLQQGLRDEFLRDTAPRL